MGISLNTDNLKTKKKKKKLNPKKALLKAMAHFRSKGIPLGFIKDKLIGGSGIDRSQAPPPMSGYQSLRMAATQAKLAGKPYFKWAEEGGTPQKYEHYQFGPRTLARLKEDIVT
tara:strand:+ start:5519 stop:5860 length:342 start_codon:yes stop_codon:yes gene_type:complete